MGRASKWFRGFLGFRRSDPNGNPSHKPSSKKRWSFSKRKDRYKSHHGGAQDGYADDDEAVHLTRGGGFERPATTYGADYWILEERAAVVIQSHFRAYLSRRALRALRALVKLQALVRGHILRKQNVDKLQQLQALVRVQARARAGTTSESPHSITRPSRFNHAARASQERVDRLMKHEQPMIMSKRNMAYDPEKSPQERRKGEASCEQGGSFTRIIHVDDVKNDKILEVDITPKRRNIFHSSHLSHSSDQYSRSFYPTKEAHTTCLSPSSGEIQSPSPFYTATNSPLYYSVSSMDGISSKRAPVTPAKSDISRSYLSGYSDHHPSYMAYTESSKAKARSLSAPKQRPQWERSSSVNRYSLQGYGDTTRHKFLTLHSSFSTKAYPGSGRLDRLGMPVRDVAAGYGGSLGHRY
ncbi:hypothetical protein C2S51_012505 [Perilla frutescens var. frutescens]|nr:hypothetical protein C2S51_012505 [Perilla frutescens var. frutescens]